MPFIDELVASTDEKLHIGVQVGRIRLRQVVPRNAAGPITFASPASPVPVGGSDDVTKG
jgi:hypothetical protein